MTQLAFIGPPVAFEAIDLEECNALLVQWGHRMGPLKRPFPPKCYALRDNGTPVCVVAHANLIAERVGGGLKHLTRENTVELARLCSSRPGLCRVGLRLWREFVLPHLGYQYAISYQDADLHTGNTYRFDGWVRGGYSVSGTHARSGLKGRKKWIWVWEVKR